MSDRVRVSVVIRSYNRLEALGELLAALREQDHPDFEVVVVEQSTQHTEAGLSALAEHERDPRIRVIRVPPQGGARARNIGAMNSRGEIVVFIDDDDLPAGPDFLTRIELPFREDPLCLGVTCRHRWGSDEIPGWYRFFARRRCMKFTRLTRIPQTWPRYDRRAHADYVHGSGGAYRRSVFERFGYWDEDTPIEDEASLALRVRGKLAPGEHFAFDPRALLQRRMDVAGGLAKRWLKPRQFYGRYMTFVHHILGRYHPNRVRFLYPLYVLAVWIETIGWLWDHSIGYSTTSRRLFATIGFTLALPWIAIATAIERSKDPPRAPQPSPHSLQAEAQPAPDKGEILAG